MSSLRDLIHASISEMIEVPRISPQTALMWLLLFPAAGGFTGPLESARFIVGAHVVMLTLRFGQFIRIWAATARKAASAVPRAERDRLEAAARRVARVVRNMTLAYLLVHMMPTAAAIWTLQLATVLMLQEVSVISSRVRSAMGMIGAETRPAAGTGGLPSGAPHRSAPAAPEKPAKHRTERYEVIDEGPHFGRVARGSLLQVG